VADSFKRHPESLRIDGLSAIMTGGAQGLGAAKSELLVAGEAKVMIADARCENARSFKNLPRGERDEPR
jgi:NAD(P)-dependent dehydrogenase (short-subunit alcohol dehydrogenase family)